MHADLDPVGEPALGRALARELGLRLRQRDADDAARRGCSAAWMAKLPQPQPTSSTRSPALEAELACRPARASSPAPPRASSRRARRSRSCRSSTRRGTARRTRWRRRSGGGPRARRARGCGGGRAGAARRRRRAAGAAGRRRARRRAPAAPASPRSSGGGCQLVEQLERRVEVVDLELARHVGAAEAELAGRAQRVGRARPASAPRSVGRRRRWSPAACVPSQSRPRTGARAARDPALEEGARDGTAFRDGTGPTRRRAPATRGGRAARSGCRPAGSG